MKSIINNACIKEKNPYPILMIFGKKKNFVVLFTSSSTGMVVYANDSDWLVGDISHEFLINEFIPFDGEITLSN